MGISNEEMFKRIARFNELMPMDYKQMKGGEAVPRSMQGFSVIGHVTKAAPAIPGDHGFTVAFNKVQPGKGAPLHSHTVVEVFVPLSGRWKFFWGEEGNGEAELGPWDTRQGSWKGSPTSATRRAHCSSSWAAPTSAKSPSVRARTSPQPDCAVSRVHRQSSTGRIGIESKMRPCPWGLQ
jgi:hypothetical protein